MFGPYFMRIFFSVLFYSRRRAARGRYIRSDYPQDNRNSARNKNQVYCSNMDNHSVNK